MWSYVTVNFSVTEKETKDATLEVEKPGEKAEVENKQLAVVNEQIKSETNGVVGTDVKEEIKVEIKPEVIEEEKSEKSGETDPVVENE